MKYVTATVLLMTALAFGQTWVVEQVDSTAASGSPVELVRAADGRLWAGYKTTSGAARVACLGDSGWVFTDVFSPARLPSTLHRPFLAASPHGELCLACSDSAGNSLLCRMAGDTWRSEASPFNDSYPCSTVAYDTSGRLYTLLEPWVARFMLAHETDTGWTTGEVVQLPTYWYYTWYDVGLLVTDWDGSPWFFGFCGWDDWPYKGSYETVLLHFTGDTWTRVWDVYGWPDQPPIPIALVPDGDGVGILTYHSDSVLCDSEPVMGWGDYLAVAGLAYLADHTPLAAIVPTAYDPAVAPYFAYKTNRWHISSVPGPAGLGGIDIETDTSGEVVIVYSTQDSGLWCARGTDVVGAEETPHAEVRTPKCGPTILSGACIRSLESKVIFDAMGRRVINPKPGVYFIRDEGRGAGDAGRTCKVVVQK
jgi:hypothetical protein